MKNSIDRSKSDGSEKQDYNHGGSKTREKTVKAGEKLSGAERGVAGGVRVFMIARVRSLVLTAWFLALRALSFVLRAWKAKVCCCQFQVLQESVWQ